METLHSQILKKYGLDLDIDSKVFLHVRKVFIHIDIMVPEIQKLKSGDLEDFVSLLQIFAEVFEWDNFILPKKEYLQRLLDKPNFWVFVARIEARVVGGLTVHILEGYEEEKPSAYIYDLGVSPDFQRQGIGKALIATVVDFCKAQNCKEMFVQADAEDLHAVEFYRATGADIEMPAVHFTYCFDK